MSNRLQIECQTTRRQHCNSVARNIACQYIDTENISYDQFVSTEQFSPAIIYNVYQGIYYFTYGPFNSPGYKLWPPKRDFEGELEGTQPLVYYTPIQLQAYAFITEIIDETHIKVYDSQLLPTAPFYLYYVIYDEEHEVPCARCKCKLKVLENIDNVLTIETLPSYVGITGPNNYPYLAFYRIQIDELVEYDHSEPPNENEMKIPYINMWNSWSYRPHSFHQISPLRAYTYVDCYKNTWMYPVPYADYTFDEQITDPDIQYGYDTSHAFDYNTLVFYRAINTYMTGALTLFPIAESLTYLPAFTAGFAKSTRNWYFQLRPEVKYRLYKRDWS